TVLHSSHLTAHLLSSTLLSTLISIRFYDFFDSTTHLSICRPSNSRATSEHIRTLLFCEHSAVHPYHRRYYKRRLLDL
ncbi:hypothetical protein BDZ45DRAFT_682535, partial [Acephala macrosclerotiorum]